eukprot:11706665-Alexandrium_andersonii.AAC.1
MLRLLGWTPDVRGGDHRLRGGRVWRGDPTAPEGEAAHHGQPPGAHAAGQARWGSDRGAPETVHVHVEWSVSAGAQTGP